MSDQKFFRPLNGAPFAEFSQPFSSNFLSCTLEFGSPLFWPFSSYVSIIKAECGLIVAADNGWIVAEKGAEGLGCPPITHPPGPTVALPIKQHHNNNV